MIRSVAPSPVWAPGDMPAIINQNQLILILSKTTWLGVSAGAADCGRCDGKETSLHSHPLLLLLLLIHLLRAPVTIQRLVEALRAALATRVVEEGGGGRGWRVPGKGGNDGGGGGGDGGGDGGRKKREN